MTNIQKGLLYLGGIVLLGALVFIIVKQVEISKRQQAIETQVTSSKELADGITRAQTQWATKEDIDNLAKNNNVSLKVIQDDLSKLGASINGINVATVSSTGQNLTNISSSSVLKGGPGAQTLECNGTMVACPDPNGYQSNEQFLKLNEQFGTLLVPFGQVGFSAWKDKPWDVVVQPRKYTATTVLGRDETGKDYAYNKLQIETGDQMYELKLDSSKFLQEYPNPKFTFWNPRLFLGVSGGLNVQQTKADFVPSISISSMSYGQYLSTPSWVFLTLGAGYATQERKINFLITPVSYNIGQLTPLTRNIYLGPSVGFDTSGNFSILATLNVGL